VEMRNILSQGSFDFGWARRLSNEEHFQGFETALTEVVRLLIEWFGVTRAIWEAKKREDNERFLSRFLKGKVPMVHGIDITNIEALAGLAHDLYFTNDSFEFRVVLWSEDVAVALEGCSDPIVFSFTVRPPRGER